MFNACICRNPDACVQCRALPLESCSICCFILGGLCCKMRVSCFSSAVERRTYVVGALAPGIHACWSTLSLCKDVEIHMLFKNLWNHRIPTSLLHSHTCARSAARTGRSISWLLACGFYILPHTYIWYTYVGALASDRTFSMNSSKSKYQFW